VKNVHVCSFSSPAAELPKGKRNSAHVIDALRDNPRVSTWDLSEMPWLRRCIADLKRRGLIVEDKSERFPWHRYSLTSTTDEAESL